VTEHESSGPLTPAEPVRPCAHCGRLVLDSHGLLRTGHQAMEPGVCRITVFERDPVDSDRAVAWLRSDATGTTLLAVTLLSLGP
jgi:hypothetical protein